MSYNISTVKERGDKMYFDYPMQVKYFDERFNQYKYGIAYHDEIIRAIDGKPIKLSNLWKRFQRFSENDLVIPLVWTDITKKIDKKS